MSYVASGRCVRQHGARFHQPGKGPWKEGPWIIGASHQGKAALPREASEHVGGQPGLPRLPPSAWGPVSPGKTRSTSNRLLGQ